MKAEKIAARFNGLRQRLRGDRERVIKILAENYVRNSGTGINPLWAAKHLEEKYGESIAQFVIFGLLLAAGLGFNLAICKGVSDEYVLRSSALIVLLLVTFFAVSRLSAMIVGKSSREEAEKSVLGFWSAIELLEFELRASQADAWQDLGKLSIIAERFLVNAAWCVKTAEGPNGESTHEETTLRLRKQLRELLEGIKLVASPRHQNVGFDPYYRAAAALAPGDEPKVSWGLELHALGTPELFRL